jgi:glycosyltransferase involved in cell wall biosynthesis
MNGKSVNITKYCIDHDHYSPGIVEVCVSKIESRIHVGLVAPLPPPFGGMANQACQLQDLLRSEGVSVTLVQTNAPYQPEIIGKVRVVRAFFRIVPYLLRLWRVAGRVDLFHIFANSGWSWQLFTAPAVWIAWLRNTPVIINYHGGGARDYLNKSIRWIRPTLKRASDIVVPSGFLREVFLEYGVDAEIIPIIIDLDRFKPCPQRRERYQSGPHLVVTRNLESIYDIQTAIHAVSILSKTVSGIRLSIAGDGPQRTQLHELVRQLGLEDTVTFTGRLTLEDIASLYQEADIMLNPTTVDNMPNSVLESLACGIPVITTDVGGIPYIVQDGKTALMVEVGDAEGMAAQVNRLLQDSSLFEALVENGKKEVMAYTWSEIKQKWLGKYTQLTTI